MKKYTLIVGLLVINSVFGSYLYCMQSNHQGTRLYNAMDKGNLQEFKSALHDYKGAIQLIEYQHIFPGTDAQGLHKRSLFWLTIQKILDVLEFESADRLNQQIEIAKTLLKYQLGNQWININERNYFFIKSKNICGIRSNQTCKGTLLHMIVLCGDAELMELFLKKKPQLDVLDDDGKPPLFYVVREDDEEMTELLVKAGASTYIETKQWYMCGKKKKKPLSEWAKNRNIRHCLVVNGRG